MDQKKIYTHKHMHICRENGTVKANVVKVYKCSLYYFILVFVCRLQYISK